MKKLEVLQHRAETALCYILVVAIPISELWVFGGGFFGYALKWDAQNAGRPIPTHLPAFAVVLALAMQALIVVINGGVGFADDSDGEAAEFEIKRSVVRVIYAVIAVSAAVAAAVVNDFALQVAFRFTACGCAGFLVWAEMRRNLAQEEC